jgi:transcriptional regulator with PAS, ATPase and Fis domain
VVTPRLQDQLEDSPEQLHNLLLFIARHVAGPEEAESLAGEVGGWIGAHLPPDYPWPGNVRELEQCVRNILIRRTYQPFQSPSPQPREAFFATAAARKLTVDELVRGYCTVVYAESGSYEKAAQHLGVDRRTVKAQLDLDLLEALRNT